MSADTLPPGAYEAAASAGPGARDPLLAGLLAAAPLIRAAEMERIRQLAIEHKAEYPLYERPGLIVAHPPFADLLRAEPPPRSGIGWPQ